MVPKRRMHGQFVREMLEGINLIKNKDLSWKCLVQSNLKV